MMRAAFVLACITFALAWSYFQPFDDSDTPPKRSGVIPFTDALTGCQYLKTPWPSSITPRLGQDGKQICKKDTPMTNTTNTSAASGAADNCTILPDGSAFAVGSFPLPQDHWLYAPHEYEPGADEPKELLAPILTHAQRNEVVAAVRYAVRGATMCGKEPDFDPDALVQNAVYALCGSFGRTALAAPAQPAPAAVAGPSEFPHEKMDAVALGRYKAVSSDQSMFYRFAVVAGDGAQQLYIGREVDCQNMARKFAGAFLDGAFAYHSMTAAPTTQPAPQLPERDASVPAEQQGLFRKFDVRRVDGSDQPGGKHHGCRYFVLDVDHDQHAHAALTAYAAACESSHPELAADLRSKWGAAPTTQPAPQQEAQAGSAQGDALDAERWRALLACGRIRIIGTAGVTGTGAHDPKALDPNKQPYGNYVHFGAEFWSTFPDQDYYNTKENPAYARATLTEFADAARAAQEGKTP